MYTITKSTNDFATTDITFDIDSIEIFDNIDNIDFISDECFNEITISLSTNVCDMLSFYVSRASYEKTLREYIAQYGVGYIYHDCAQYTITPL